MTAALQLEGVAVERDGHIVLDQIDLRVDAGATLALAGPSGSGKTTLLRVIVGLEAPTRGQVVLFDRTVATAHRVLVRTEERRIAMVFQDLGLWPHMSVDEHLQFALRAQAFPKVDRRSLVRRMLQSVGLQGRELQKPATLSGGERQRLAIARALITEPSMLLLDEPLSNLDVVLKQELIALLLMLVRDRQTTTVLVTHDPHEAMALAHKLAVLEGGRIVQHGTAAELAHSPATAFVRALMRKACGPEVSSTEVFATTSRYLKSEMPDHRRE